MGRDNDEQQHRVTLTKGFYMQTTEVTQGQWRVVMLNNPSYFKNCGDNCPVESISWDDCQKFIHKLNKLEGGNKYRLPTESEWEYACRAGRTTKFCFGDSGNSMLDEYAWHNDNSLQKTHSVAQKKPNDWCLYDMHGNVWEWCQDWKVDYPSEHIINPKSPLFGSVRVVRGGSWYNDGNRYCRAANRRFRSPEFMNDSLGFRLVRTH